MRFVSHSDFRHLFLHKSEIYENLLIIEGSTKPFLSVYIEDIDTLINIYNEKYMNNLRECVDLAYDMYLSLYNTIKGRGESALIKIDDNNYAYASDVDRDIVEEYIRLIPPSIIDVLYLYEVVDMELIADGKRVLLVTRKIKEKIKDILGLR